MIRFRRPPWWAMLLTAAAALLFVRLGFWQLHRADFKEAILRRYAAAVSAPAQDFSTIKASLSNDSFPRVRVRGHYLADRIYLLDNPKHDGRGGVEVYAPFVVPDASRLLLVDMGFLPGSEHGKPPAIPALPSAEIIVQGLYVPPPPVGFEMGGDALTQQAHWPKSSIFMDPAEIAKDLRQPLYPRWLALDAEAGSPYLRVHTPDFSAMPPSRHRAYAFQWFTFALAVVVILLVLNRKRKPRKP